MNPITTIPSSMLAPCGMNCGVCMAFLRTKNRCVGCNSNLPDKPPHCHVCSIKTCDNKPGIASFCFECEKFPCRRLKNLDKRYRGKYRMSMIDNLINIKALGLEKFMETENARWVCQACGNPVCVHNGKCYSCGSQYEVHKKYENHEN